MHEIEIENLVKKFGSFAALDGISLSVELGECFALLGPNGAGKTTLIKILSTLIVPTSGTVKVAGHDIKEEAEEIKRLIGVVSHNSFLYEELSARENLEFYAELYGASSSRAEELLGKFNLQARSEDCVSAFSRGMKQRLAIARALLHEPKILLLDEPSTGLDARSRAEFHDSLQNLRSSGATIILATHQLDEAKLLCERAVLLSRGRVMGEFDLKRGSATVERALLELE